MSGENSGSLINTGANIGSSLLTSYLDRNAAEDASNDIQSGLDAGLATSSEAIKSARGDVLSTGMPGLEDLMSGFQGSIGMLEQRGPAEQMAGNLSGAYGNEAQQAGIDSFIESPGQEYLRNQQEQSLLRNSAAIGGLGGGRVRSALQEQAFGNASTNQQQFLQNLVQQSIPEQTRSTNIANVLGSAGGQVANYRQGLGTNLANLTLGGAAQQIPLLTGTGEAQAAGTLAANTAVTNGLGGVSKTLGNLNF